MRKHRVTWRNLLRVAFWRSPMDLRPLNMSKEEPASDKPKPNKFEWADEGVSTLVRVIILAWSAAILSLNYITIPGIPQRQIDPTFIASVFTGTLASFGVVPAKKKEEVGPKKDETTPKPQ